MTQNCRKIALLGVLTMLAVVATASAAYATTIQFEWKVNSAVLASGATREFVAKDKTAVHLNLELSGIGIELTSSKLKVRSGAEIVGGKPGGGSGILELESVKVANLSNCGVREVETGSAPEKLTTRLLKVEVVERAVGKAGEKTSELLFSPQTGTVMASFEMIGSGCALKGLWGSISGKMLAETGPQKAEAKSDALIFVHSGSTEYKNSASEFRQAALEIAGEKVTLSGEAEMELVSKEAFGAF